MGFTKTLEQYMSKEVGNSPDAGVVSKDTYYRVTRMRRIFEKDGREAAQAYLDNHRKQRYDVVKRSYQNDPDKLDQKREWNNIRAKERYWKMRAENTEPPRRLGRPRTIII